MIRHYGIALLFFLLCGTASARQLVRADMQLANSAVLDMHQDEKGYMWIGTYDGLHLYDGKSTRVFRMELDNEFSLCSNIVQRIVPAEKGYLWLATSLGINRFSTEERRVVKSYLQYVDVENLISDSCGNTLFFIGHGKVACYDSSTGEISDFSLPGSEADAIVCTWSERKGSFSSVNRRGEVVEYQMSQDGDNRTLSLTNRLKCRLGCAPVRKAAYADGQLIIIDDKAALWSFDFKTRRLNRLTDLSDLGKMGSTSSVIKVFGSDIYIGFYAGALYHIPLAGGELQSIDSDYRIFCLLSDRNQDILWVGTDGYGVMMYCDRESPFSSLMLRNLLPKIKKPVRAIHADGKGDLWIGTKGDGVIRISDYERFADLDRQAFTGGQPARITRFMQSEGLAGNEVFSFFRDTRRNILWFGASGDRLSWYSYADNRIHSTPLRGEVQQLDAVHQLVAMNDTLLYIASDMHCLAEVRLSQDPDPEIRTTYAHRFFHGDRDCNNFYALERESDSTLLIGLRGGYGVMRFNIRTRAYEFLDFSKLQSRAIGDVLSICHSSGNLYIGASSGLLCFKENGNITYFTQQNGMANDMVHGVLEDDFGSLWLSTNKGLVQYLPDHLSFHNYASPDIAVTEFCDDAFWKCPTSGRLFFGGVDGVVWIDPEQGDDDSTVYSPDLQFTDMETNDGVSHPVKSLMKNGILEIGSRISRFSLSFIAIDYLNGKNYEYSYRMNGSGDWTELGKDNRVTFVRLPAGKYDFEVRYRSNVMASPSKVYLLKIGVLPPWYGTWWAILCYAALFLCFVWLYFHWLRIHFRRKQKRVVARLEEEQREKIYEARTNFFVNISHELCTPLTLIDGMNECIARATASDGEMKKYTDTMRENIRNLKDLIQEIIDFRKIEENGFGPVKIESVNLSEMLRQQMSPFFDIAAREAISIELQAGEALKWNTDTRLFKMIVYNLLSNAVKYTPPKGRITVGISIGEEQMELKVGNTGKGMSREQLATVFDRYRLLDNMDSNMYTSTAPRNGLGLFICRELAETLGGKVTADSIEGQRTEFTVTLPCREADTTVVHTNAGQEDGPGFGLLAQDGEKRKPSVLVVDDNQDIVWMIEKALSKQYNVRRCYNVEEAVSAISESTPDLIITDIIMEGESGLQLIAKIRADKYLKNIPVIVISAKIAEQEQIEGLDTGADAYFTKPFSLIVLSATVARLIESRRQLKEYYNNPESSYTIVEGQKMHQTEKAFMDTVVETIRQNIESEDFSVESLAEKLGLTPRNLYRRFKKISGRTPSDFIKEYRLDLAVKLLTTTDLTIQEIMYRVGISNRSYFSREFQKKFGVRPKEYRTND